MRGSTGRSCVSLVLLKSGCVCVTNVTKNVYVKLKESNEKFIEKRYKEGESIQQKKSPVKGTFTEHFRSERDISVRSWSSGIVWIRNISLLWCISLLRCSLRSVYWSSILCRSDRLRSISSFSFLYERTI